MSEFWNKIWKKTVTCAVCGQPIEVVSFHKPAGSYRIGQGYLCTECTEGKKNASKAEKA